MEEFRKNIPEQILGVSFEGITKQSPRGILEKVLEELSEGIFRGVPEETTGAYPDVSEQNRKDFLKKYRKALFECSQKEFLENIGKILQEGISEEDFPEESSKEFLDKIQMIFLWNPDKSEGDPNKYTARTSWHNASNIACPRSIHKNVAGHVE